MDKDAIKFFSKDEEFKKAIESGKDVYSFLASKMFECPYDDCHEYKNGFPNLGGKRRRDIAKSILCAMYFSTKRKWHKDALHMLGHISLKEWN